MTKPDIFVFTGTSGDRVVRLFLYVDKQSVRERLESKGTGPEWIDHILNQGSHPGLFA